MAICVSPRSQRLLLRCRRSTRRVELVLPRGVAAGTVGLKFLAAQHGWISSPASFAAANALCRRHTIVPVLGVPHRICRESDPAAPAVVLRDGAVSVRVTLAHLPRRVRDHLAQLAVRELARRARGFAERIDKKIARITVRDTKSRWGSRSSNGSAVVQLAARASARVVVDYVVAHEVAHPVDTNSHG